MKPKIVKSEFNHITSQDEDLFGRDKFVDAIVDKIVQRSKVNTDCETIGVYGKWGEGKSSVLKLIKNKLDESQKIDNKRFRRVDFNPWYFKDQESLLFDFFSVLQKGFSTKDIKDSIKKYAPFVSFGTSRIMEIIAPGVGSLVGKGLQELLEAITNVKSDLNSLKDEVDQSIILAQEHVVVFIDDVDRLDKKEMHALFKLIKQGADFINVTYVIAMDMNIVAKSISAKYEDGNEDAGRNFINKIVQYPYTLPKIQEGYIYKMLYEGLKQKYEEIAKDEKEEMREPDFEAILITILPLFTTPRDVLLYINSFSFGYKFLHNEVCLEDLCYLKVLKMFYPKGYNLIKNSKHVILAEHIINQYNKSEDDVLKGNYKFINEVFSSYEGSQKAAIEAIVRELLIPMNDKIHNMIEVNEKKRLCSPIYFDKYFIYTNPEGVISDTQKELFINSLPSFNDDELLIKLEFFFKNYEYNEFTRVIRSTLHYRHNYNLNIESVQRICVALSLLSVNKKRTQYTEFSAMVHIEIFIVVILNSYMYELENDEVSSLRLQNEIKQIETFKKIVDSDELIPFHLFFATHFIQEGTAYQNNKEEVNKSVFHLINKYIAQYSLADIFELSEIPTYTLFSVWNELDTEEYHKAVNEYMFRDDFELVPFLQKMIVRETRDDSPFKNTSYNYKKFNKFCSLFDADKMYEKVKDVKPEDVQDYDDTIGYFIHAYKQQKDFGDSNGVITSTYSTQ